MSLYGSPIKTKESYYPTLENEKILLNDYDNYLNTLSKFTPAITRSKFIIKKSSQNDFCKANTNAKIITSKLKILNNSETTKLNDEIIKLKTELHQKTNELNFLKVEYKKIEEENKKIFQMVEFILKDAGIYYKDLIRKNQIFESLENSKLDLPEFNSSKNGALNERFTELLNDSSQEFNPLKEILGDTYELKINANANTNALTNLSSCVNKFEYKNKNILKLQESATICKFKKKITNQKYEISLKNDEISYLKNCTRQSNFINMESNLKKRQEEISKLQFEIESLKKLLNE